MNVVDDLKEVFVNCCKNADKEKIKNIKIILNKKNKKKDKELEKLFEFLSDLLNQDLEKEVMKINISSLKDKKKEILFNNLRKIFKAFTLFKSKNEYIEVLCDFLFYLFKYMRKLNVKKTYKLIKKVTKEDKEYAVPFIENYKKEENEKVKNKKVEIIRDEVNIKDKKETKENSIDKNKNKNKNVGNKENMEIEYCLNSYNNLIFNFLLNSNILIYLEKLKKEDSKNLLCDEHYFFTKLKNSIFNKKYILELSNSLHYIILKYPKFPLFIDSLFNTFFFVRNKLIIFFIKNIYKRITDILILKNNEINKKITIKKYYSLLFCVYLLYKIKLIIYLYLNSQKYYLLNDYIEPKTIVDLYIKIIRDYKNSIYYCFYTINNRKYSQKNSQSLCLVVIYLINLIYTNHKDILKVFECNTNKCTYFKKYKDLFYQYNKILENLFKNNENNSFTQNKMKNAILNNIFAKNNNNLINKKKKKVVKDNIDSEKIYYQNEIMETDTKLYNTNKYIKNYLINKAIREDDYSFCFIISFLYTLTNRSIKLYDYDTILKEIIFYKRMHFNEIYSESCEVLNNQNNSTKVELFDYSKILYNNFFLNLIKNNFYFYINIDKSILNYFFINEFQKFLMNKNLNYKNLYYLMGYKINDKYHEMNILLLFQKIILRNILKYTLHIENKKGLNYEWEKEEKTAGMEQHIKNNLVYFFNKNNKKLKALNINEFHFSQKGMNELIKKNSENTFIVLNNLNFLDFNNSVKNFFFDKNIINILLFQITKEAFAILKFLHASNLKKKEEMNIYFKNLNFLVIILKSVYSLINSFLSLMKIIESDKKCILFYNDKKQYVLFSDEYYEEIKDKKRNTQNEKKVFLSFEEKFHKKCMKKKHFKILNKFIKLYISIIKEKYIKQKVFCDNEFIEVAKIIFFVFDFMIFYFFNSIQHINEKNVNNLKELKNHYCNLFNDINNMYELIKSNQNMKKKLTDNLVNFSKSYLIIYQKLNSKMDKNYFSFFVNYNYIEITKKEDNQISKEIYNQLKNLTMEEIYNSKISDNEISEIIGNKASGIILNSVDADYNNREVDDYDNDNEEDIVVSNSFLLDLLADESKKKEKKTDIPKKKRHSKLFYNIIYLLKYFKINIKNECAESIIKSLYYMLYSLIIISKKTKLISKKMNEEEEEKDDENESENEGENEIKNEKPITSIYIEDLTNLGKILKHILLSFKVNKNIKIKNCNELNSILNKYLFKIITLIIKETKNIDLIKISIKCLEYYNTIENKIINKNNNVINYLFEFLKILYFVPHLKDYYSKFLNVFFKSGFVRYMNINELFNQTYKKYFHQIISKFLSDFNISDYLYNKIKIKNMNILDKKKYIKKTIGIIREACKKKHGMREEDYNSYMEYTQNENSLLNTFNINNILHIIHNVCIFLNKALTDNDAYVFKKKVSLNLLGLLKKISNILYIKDDNILIIKDQLIKNLVEVYKFHNALDEKLHSQKIYININTFNKKLVSLLESLKPFEINYEENPINGLKQDNIKHKKKSNKRILEKSVQIRKKIKT